MGSVSPSTGRFEKIGKSLTKEIPSFLVAMSGLTILAISINIFSWQYQLVSGGFPGIGLVIATFTDFSVGQILLFLNIVIFSLIILFGSKNLAVKTAIGYFIFPILVDLTRTLLHLTSQHSLGLIPSLFLISLQSLIAGAAASLFISRGYSAGGWGALAFVVKKYFSISTPNFMFFMDVLLTLLVSVFMSVSKGLLLGLNSLFFYYSFRYSLQFVENTKKK